MQVVRLPRPDGQPGEPILMRKEYAILRGGGSGASEAMDNLESVIQTWLEQSPTLKFIGGVAVMYVDDLADGYSPHWSCFQAVLAEVESEED